MRAGWVAAGLLVAMLTGCAEPARPDFLVRLQEDCRGGDQDACNLLALPVPPSAGPQSPRSPRPQSLVQRDVEAIMRGMDRIRATPRAYAAPVDETDG